MQAAIAHCGGKAPLKNVSGVSWTHIKGVASGKLPLGTSAAKRLVDAQGKFPDLSIGYRKKLKFPDATVDDWKRGYLLAPDDEVNADAG